MTDDFFELGGHSLSGIRLASRLSKEFGVKLSLGDLFSSPTLEQQAQLIEQGRKAAFTSIPQAAPHAGYPLSSAQRRLWLLSQLEGGNAAYNIPGAFVFEGALDSGALGQALRYLVGRHESLRTVFRADEAGEIKQYILPAEDAGFELTEADLRAVPAAEARVHELVLATGNAPFDLATGPLLRAGLFQTADDQWVFACSMHHIISDGWSMGILVSELLTAYAGYCQGQAPTLAPLRIQYKDYTCWQQAQSDTTNESHRAFWQQQLAGELPILALPGDKVRPALKTYHGDAVTLRLDATLTKGLRALVQAQEATLFMGLLAAVNAVLYRYTGQEDIVLGTVVAGREHNELEDQIGLYLNTLPLRTRFSGAASFSSLLRTIKAGTLAAYEHQEYPFDELVNALRVQHDKSRNPLFDVSVVLQIADMPQAEGLGHGALDVKAYPASTGYISKFDISFDFVEAGDELHASLVFNTDIYLRPSIEQLGQHLLQLLQAALASPEQALEKLDYLRPAEKRLLTETFNDTAVAFPQDQSIGALFAEQVARTPDKVAVSFENVALTYQELHAQSDKLAHYLRTEAQVQPGDCVGLLLDRSEKVIVAILGILKAGAAYVPVDVEHPRARQEFVLADTGAQVLITQTDYLFDLDFYTGSMFAIDVQLEDLAPADPLPVLAGPDSLAYVLYTSGSTGQPKGVLVNHVSVVRLVKSSTFVPFTGDEVLMATGALSFDATTFEYWGTLLNGGQLVMTRRDVLLDTKALGAEISRRGVSLMWFTAGWLNQLVDVDLTLFAGLQTIVAGGDKLSPAHIQRLRQAYPGLTIVNGYGPTENTTFSLTYPVTDATTGAIPIGKPISNSQAYILDHCGGLLPIGAVGEICVSGTGLARGYLNQPELTAERFVPNPFRAGERMYRTGDLGRWLPDGNVAYLGRTDNQVKIRGFRVELAEIESTLQQLSGIDTAVVLARPDAQGEQALVAYLAGANVPTDKDIRTYLEAQLPAYMVPAHLVHLEAFPLTLNGKINRNALPDPTSPAEQTEYVAPRTEQEAQLAAIWQQLLGRDSVGVTDNFFEIGGDSIKILRMVSEVRQKMSLEIAVADIYKHGSIEHILAHCLQHQGQAAQRAATEAAVRAEIEALKERILATLSPAEQANVEDIFPMSDIEKGMVYESLVQTDRGIYHDQLVHQRAYPGFDLDRFRHALALLVQKHATLRTSFRLGTLEADVQVVHRTVPIELPYEDLTGLELRAQEATVQAYLAAEHQRPFDVTQAPLWRMKAFGLGADEVVIILQFHHAILDGWSHASFVTELNNLYLQLGDEPDYQPTPLKSSYKDFIVQHEADKQDAAVRAYWQQELADYKRLDLFSDEQQEFTRAAHIAEPAYERQLDQLAAELRTSVKTISLTAYLYLLRLLSYEGDILAGLVTNTRPGCEDGDKVLGCFLNTIPLRMPLDDELSAAQLIGQVHTKLIGLKENERLSLLEIASLHNVQLRAGNPFFDTFFNYIDFHTYAALQDSAQVQQEADITGHTHTNILLDVSVERTGGIYSVSFMLSQKLHSGLTAEDLCQLYLRILDGFLNRTYQPMRLGNYLGTEDTEQLVHAYNDTATAYDGAGTVTELFAAQVQAHPHLPAVVFEHTTLTYQQLNERANQLARFLQAHYRVQPDELVGLQLERSEWLIVSILAVLKAGAAYVPIDPGYPQERIEYIVQNSECKAVVDAAVLDVFQQEMTQWSAADLPVVDEALQRLAYVIYTSGSTGKPKGVAITHHNLRNYICWANEHYFGDGTRPNFGLFTSLSFDLTVTSLLSPLTLGGQVYVYPQRAEIHDVLAHCFGGEAGINAVKLTPSHLNVLAGLGLTTTGVSCAILGGEQLTASQVRTLHTLNPAMRVYNEYGPTETTVGCVVALVQPDEAIRIGQPIANTQVYVLNSAGMLVPPGVVGELFISGDGVAQGYLHRPELTAERFTLNPWQPGTRRYATGDLVRWNPAGELEYLGRKDNQVKIRGHRIELGEVETALSAHPDVEAAAVLCAEVRGDKELVAYFVASNPLHAPALRQFLSQHLPAHMLPGHYVQLAALPLSPNGKLDKKQLPAPLAAGDDTGVAYVAPRTATEARLQAIWQEVLGREQIGVTENFFDAGGHSIKVVRLASHIYKAFEVKLPLTTLFTVAVLQEQAQLLEQARKTAYASIPALPEQAHYPLSSAQHRLWVLSQFAGESETYNIPAVYQLEGEVDPAAMESAFAQLIRRHEILRTVFQEDGRGEVWQVIKTAEELGFAITYQQARTRQEVEQLVEQVSVAPFDLAAGPLLRVTMIETGNGQWILAYVMHHIISDGWSANIVLHELLTLYRAHQQGQAPMLPPLRIQYKDYAAWQRQQLEEAGFADHKAYWLNQLAGELPVLALPKDKARPAQKTHNGATLQVPMPVATVQQLQGLARSQQATLFMGLLAAVNVLLYSQTGQEDIIIGSPVAGREHADLENQLGFYLNTLPLRTRFTGDAGFGELLAGVQQVTLEAYEHQAYPFDALVEALQLPRDASRNFLFDVWLVLHNANVNALDEESLPAGMQVSSYEPAGPSLSKFDLLFSFAEVGELLHLSLEYNTDLFSAAEASVLAEQFTALLHTATAQPDKPLRTIREELLRAAAATQQAHQQQVRLKNISKLKNKTL
ncbi:non-ribosomal peptide synthetase [Hymenobacter sp. CRA2]|uniref:non-ribosomal peptide synthetase n=1 Tax=Hymenobacter sp. CRA2 TaxID=1955620 RepID=UPI0020C97D21|nr:non-ribosomal peptide synthetase [Hymenobacter sp. CRA2]